MTTHTQQSLEALTARELDCVVAEVVMGWANVDLYQTLSATKKHWCGIDPVVNDHRPIPIYSTDDNAARLVRNRIAFLRKAQFFINYLCQTQIGTTEFSMMQASPRWQAIAAILAVEGGK